jgi:2-haloacid dehalogenase
LEVDSVQNIGAVVFDAYGTLYDVHSVLGACEAEWPGQGRAVSQMWRVKQLEYSWLRTLMDRYEPFQVVTADALAYACQALRLPLSDDTRVRLMEQYQRLEVYPEVREALTALGPGRQLVIFSIGSPAMLEPLIEHSGLGKVLTGWLSADEVRLYKPTPGAYALVPSRLEVPAKRTLFVSSNPWDVAGAKNFGFIVAWVNRNGAVFDQLGVTPDLVVSDLSGIPEQVGRGPLTS